MVVITDVRHAIANQLRDISDLVVLDHWPDNLTGMAAVVQPARDPFMQRITLSGGYEQFWDVVLLVPIAGGGDVRAQQTLDTYLDDSGTRSIWAALEGTSGTAQTMGDLVSDLEVQNVFGYAAIFVIGTTAFLSCSWRVRVMV